MKNVRCLRLHVDDVFQSVICIFLSDRYSFLWAKYWQDITDTNDLLINLLDLDMCVY